jgi:hypothetical protein
LPAAGAEEGRGGMVWAAGGVETRIGFLGATFGGAGGGGGAVDRCSTMPLPVMVPGRCRLNSRQQEGQRHATWSSPAGVLDRVRRQPNCALISV